MSLRLRARNDAVSGRARAAGFTLVEMMIAVGLGLIVLAALTAYFVSTSQNRTELERNSRQIENGRYAIDTVREELLLAGFYSDAWLPEPGTVWQQPEACVLPDNPAPTTANAPSPPLAAGSTDWAQSPTPIGYFVPDHLSPHAPVSIYGYAAGSTMPACLDNYKAGTDVLVVRRLNSEPTTVGTQDANSYYLQVSECADDSKDTGFLFGKGSATFGPTTVTTFNLRKLDCATRANLWRYREDVYYVRTCSVCGTDNIPTLVRLELDPAAPTAVNGMNAVALVEGIEDFRVDYGIDNLPAFPNTPDGQVDVWKKCNPCTLNPPATAEWPNIVGVRIYVLSRNLEASAGYTDTKSYSMGLAGTVGPFNDGFKRHVYSAQVTLPNRLGPREPALTH